MAGIYIHIPFCKQACTYCDFHFSTSQQLRKPLIEALNKEILLRKHEVNEPIKSIYFGGGSPSILDKGEFESIAKTLETSFDLSELEEFTLESNPDDHSLEKLKLWEENGVNRLSIGIQSFIDRDLELMNRAHSSREALACVQNARNAGFKKLTIDLIFGIPGQSMNEWQDNVEKALALNTEHLSAYALTIEPKTALAHQVAKGLVIEKNDEEVEAEYRFLHEAMDKAGFEHYEISNYAISGSRAVHNASYWSGEPYLGIGPAAHSFDGKKTRRWNVSNNALYIKAIRENQHFSSDEVLTKRERTNEQIMTGLRTIEGIPKTLLSFSEIRLPNHLIDAISQTKERVSIKPENWMMADSIIQEFFKE